MVLGLLLVTGVVAQVTVLDGTGLVGRGGADRVPGAGQSRDDEPEPDVWEPTEEQWSEARRVVDDLTLEELAGQLIVARENGSGAALVRDLHLAGVIVMDPATGEDQLAEIERRNEELQRLGADRRVPVLIGIDQEGGQVARLLEPLTVFGSFMTAGAAVAGDDEDSGAESPGEEAVRDAAAASGAELRAAGFTAVFAPVADLTSATADPVIGSRSAGSDPEVVGRAVVAAMRGYGDAGMISTVKHFPGHDVRGDSHLTLPRLDGTRQDLDARDAAPFRAAVEAGAPGVMTAHLDVSAVDEGTPSSASRAVVTDWLREDLGHEGLVVSDSLEMAPLMERYPGGASAVAVIQAGNDVALMPADPRAARDALHSALQSGDLAEEQARESATRTVAWSLAQQDSESMPGRPGAGESAARSLSAAGLTVVGRSCETDLALEAVTPVGDPRLVDRFTRAAEESGLGVTGGPTVALVGNGTPVPAADIPVATDRPYVLADSTAATRIALYGSGRPAMDALVDVLTGETQARGALPVDVPGLESVPC